MKKLIGIFIVFLSLSFITILILRIWGIYIVSLDNIIKSTATLLSIGILLLILIIVYGALFKSEKGYDKTVGNKAHPKL